MTHKYVFVTKNGLIKLEEELIELKSVKRKEITNDIKTALCCGDINENAEYDRAKNEQSQLEERIAKVEETLINVKVIDENTTSTNIVGLGSKVLVVDVEKKKEFEYIIVGSIETDPYTGKISNESPIGSSLIGGKVGERIKVSVPDGIVEYKILNISR